MVRQHARIPRVQFINGNADFFATSPLWDEYIPSSLAPSLQTSTSENAASSDSQDAECNFASFLSQDEIWDYLFNTIVSDLTTGATSFSSSSYDRHDGFSGDASAAWLLPHGEEVSEEDAYVASSVPHDGPNSMA